MKLTLFIIFAKTLLNELVCSFVDFIFKLRIYELSAKFNAT